MVRQTGPREFVELSADHEAAEGLEADSAEQKDDSCHNETTTQLSIDSSGDPENDQPDHDGDGHTDAEPREGEIGIEVKAGKFFVQLCNLVGGQYERECAECKVRCTTV